LPLSGVATPAESEDSRTRNLLRRQWICRAVPRLGDDGELLRDVGAFLATRLDGSADFQSASYDTNRGRRLPFVTYHLACVVVGWCFESRGDHGGRQLHVAAVFFVTSRHLCADIGDIAFVR
jgi:hypothetical protein